MLAKWLCRPDITSDFATIRVKDYTVLVSLSSYEDLRFRRIRVRDSANLAYAQIQIAKDGRLKWVKLHRYVLNITDPAIDVHHRNHNPLDCRRENLQPLSRKDHRREHANKW